MGWLDNWRGDSGTKSHYQNTESKIKKDAFRVEQPPASADSGPSHNDQCTGDINIDVQRNGISILKTAKVLQKIVSTATGSGSIGNSLNKLSQSDSDNTSISNKESSPSPQQFMNDRPGGLGSKLTNASFTNTGAAFSAGAKALRKVESNLEQYDQYPLELSERDSESNPTSPSSHTNIMNKNKNQNQMNTTNPNPRYNRINVNSRLAMCGEILRNEIYKRSFLRPTVGQTTSGEPGSKVQKQIVLNLIDQENGTNLKNPVCTEHACRKLEEMKKNGQIDPETLQKMSPCDLIDESFEIEVKSSLIVITARSCRGILFGVGRLLRNCILG